MFSDVACVMEGKLVRVPVTAACESTSSHFSLGHHSDLNIDPDIRCWMRDCLYVMAERTARVGTTGF